MFSISSSYRKLSQSLWLLLLWHFALSARCTAHPGSSFTIGPRLLCALLLCPCPHSPWTPFFLTYRLVLEEHFCRQLPKKLCPGDQYEKTFYSQPLHSLVIWLEIISSTTLNPLFHHTPEPNIAFKKTKTLPVSDYNLLSTSCPSL